MTYLAAACFGFLVGCAAGACVGVILADKEIVTITDLCEGGKAMVRGTGIAVKRVKQEMQPAQASAPAPCA